MSTTKGQLVSVDSVRDGLEAIISAFESKIEKFGKDLQEISQDARDALQALEESEPKLSEIKSAALGVGRGNLKDPFGETSKSAVRFNRDIPIGI